MPETVTDRALAAAAHAARTVIEEELGPGVALAFLFACTVGEDRVDEPNASALAAAANMGLERVPSTIAKLVVVAVQNAREAGANVDAVPRSHPFPPPSMN